MKSNVGLIKYNSEHDKLTILDQIKHKSDLNVRILEIKITEVEAFRQAIYILQKYFWKCSFVFFLTGMGVLTHNRSILVKLYLNVFKYFKCDELDLAAEIDVKDFYHKLKNMSDDPFMLYMYRDDRSHFFLQNEETTIKIDCILVEPSNLRIGPIIFSSKINISSNKFNLICQYLKQWTYVEITSNRIDTALNITELASKESTDNDVLCPLSNKEILFRCFNDEKSNNTIDEDTDDSDIDSKKEFTPLDDETKKLIVRESFVCKNIRKLRKCYKMCDQLTFYLKNEFPVVIVLPVGTMGQMHVCFSPVENV